MLRDIYAPKHKIEMDIVIFAGRIVYNIQWHTHDKTNTYIHA